MDTSKLTFLVLKLLAKIYSLSCRIRGYIEGQMRLVVLPQLAHTVVTL